MSWEYSWEYMRSLQSEYSWPLEFTRYGDIIWTEREDQRLMNSYKKIPKNMIMNLFPGRTWWAIVTRANRLKIPRTGRHYTPEEDALLLDLYYHTDLTYAQMVRYFPHRTLASLRMRMCTMRR